MYNKITHKLDRIFSKIQVDDTLETLLLNTSELDEVYKNVSVSDTGSQSIEIQKINSNEKPFYIPYHKFSHLILQGELRFKHVQHMAHLKENDILMWIGEEYVEHGCQYYVGQRFKVLKTIKDGHLSKIIFITHGKIRHFDWGTVNQMLIDRKLILVRTELNEDFGVY